MDSRVAARSSGLDISLLGIIVAGLGLLIDRIGDAAGTTPHLIRFSDKPPGTHYPAVMPQDAALLLLADPSTTGSGPSAGGPALLSLGDLPTLVVYLGVTLVVAGPLWAWYLR